LNFFFSFSFDPRHDMTDRMDVLSVGEFIHEVHHTTPHTPTITRQRRRRRDALDVERSEMRYFVPPAQLEAMTNETNVLRGAHEHN
jgi:hypothetical protein